MDVTFTKAAGGRYFMTVIRERGVELEPRQGPGYHDYLPHDAVHLIVEREAGLSGAVFGRVAAGQNNIFTAVDPKMRRRVHRREARRRLQADERADMRRSELLASVCLPLWELRAGQRSALPPWMQRVDINVLESDLLKRILAALDEFATQWHRLEVGSSITLAWDPVTTHPGGRTESTNRASTHGPRRRPSRAPRGRTARA